MANFIKTLLLIIAICLFSCAEKSQPIPERNFYFEIKTHQNDAFTIDLAEFLKDKIPQKKYTITNHSGLTWPFYAALELNESISPDSLMPPHWFLHKMIFRDANAVLEKDDYLVEIHLMPKIDTTANYEVKISKMDSTGLTVSGGSGVHFVDTVELSSRPVIYDHFMKSIIRYSFK
jgi:hypothetical protein